MKSGNEKMLGGIGSILVILTFLPVIGWILGLVGLTLVLVAINNMSNIFNDRNIFNKAIIGVILTFISTLIFIFMFIPSVSLLFSGNNTGIGLGVLGIIFSFIIAYAISVAGYYFFKQSLVLVSAYTNINLFRTAGTFIFVGALLSIIFIGFIFIIVAWIMLAIAFFSIPDEYKTNIETKSEITS